MIYSSMTFLQWNSFAAFAWIAQMSISRVFFLQMETVSLRRYGLCVSWFTSAIRPAQPISNSRIPLAIVKMAPFLRTSFNSYLPGQNSRHFTVNILKCIFVNEKFCILIWISPEFVPKGPIDYKSALVRVMAWRRIGDKPLPEPMLT